MKYTKLQLIYIRLTTRCPLCNKRLLFKPIHENISARKFSEDDPPLAHVGCHPMDSFTRKISSIPVPDISGVNKDDPIRWTIEDSRGWYFESEAKYITEKKLTDRKDLVKSPSEKAWSYCPSSTIVGKASIDEHGAVRGELVDSKTGTTDLFTGPDTLAGMIHVLDAEMVRMKVGVWRS